MMGHMHLSHPIPPANGPDRTAFCHKPCGDALVNDHPIVLIQRILQSCIFRST